MGLDDELLYVDSFLCIARLVMTGHFFEMLINPEITTVVIY